MLPANQPLCALLPSAACAALALSAAPAAAQGVDEFGYYGPQERYESPQNYAMELRFGPYLPEVDQEFAGSAVPFKTIFGTKNRYLLGYEFDWQLLRIPKVGTVGPAGGIGYVTMDGHGLLADGTVSEQEVTLSVMPMYVVGVLRVDVIARETPVPLVPYAKAGLGAAMWWTSDGFETSRSDDGRVGRDISYGYQFALGGMFLLDVLDQESAREMDSTLGINNSYWFFEWYYSSLDGFGSGSQMQVGANTWMTGIALEM